MRKYRDKRSVDLAKSFGSSFLVAKCNIVILKAKLHKLYVAAQKIKCKSSEKGTLWPVSLYPWSRKRQQIIKTDHSTGVRIRSTNNDYDLSPILSEFEHIRFSSYIRNPLERNESIGVKWAITRVLVRILHSNELKCKKIEKLLL